MKQESNDAIVAGLLKDILDLAWDAFPNLTFYLWRRTSGVGLSPVKQNLHNILFFLKRSAPSVPLIG